MSTFPDAKMKKGRFLGFAADTTDAFCYKILTIPEDTKESSKVLVRSVIRPRYRAERAPNVFTRVHKEKLQFMLRDRKTLLLDPEDLELPSTIAPLDKYLAADSSSGSEDTDGANPMPSEESFHDDVQSVMRPGNMIDPLS